MDVSGQLIARDVDTRVTIVTSSPIRTTPASQLPTWLILETRSPGKLTHWLKLRVMRLILTPL